MSTLVEEALARAEFGVRAVVQTVRPMELVPVIVGYDTQLRTFLRSCPWPEKGRDKILAELKEQFREKNIIAYSFSAEAWAANYDRTNSKKVSPKDRDDRREIVFVFATDGIEIKAVEYDIIRDENGIISLGQRRVKHDLVSFTGLTGLLA